MTSTFDGHWHGYTWKGDYSSYFTESLRRPGHSPADPATRAFLASPMPPMITGYWLYKRDFTAATFEEAKDALSWMSERYTASPPDPKGTWPDFEMRRAGTLDRLQRGVDDTWCYWTTGSSLTSTSVVCCPNRFHPHIPCPQPLAART